MGYLWREVYSNNPMVMDTRHGFLPLLLMLLFAFMATFGGVVSAGMMMKDGKMSDCPYMGTSGYCDMSVTEHLSSWQTLFTAALKSFHASDFFSLGALAFLAPFFILSARKRPQRPTFKRWRMLELFDPLQLAFARGLIHPKLYS